MTEEEKTAAAAKRRRRELKVAIPVFTACCFFVAIVAAGFRSWREAGSPAALVRSGDEFFRLLPSNIFVALAFSVAFACCAFWLGLSFGRRKRTVVCPECQSVWPGGVSRCQCGVDTRLT